MAKNITSSSTAEYFSKNLQQVGFSSATKAILTTLKESVDNALDACEEGNILPEISITVKKMGPGHLKNTDLVKIKIEDNGPGIEPDDLIRVFGEYLASSKFGRGRCSRGQQGIGISAATTWAQMTSAKGAKVISKTKRMRNAISCMVEVDIKNNKGLMKNRESIKWDRDHGVSVEFQLDGRVQLGGEGGLITYLTGTTLVNPHLTLHYKLLDNQKVTIKRVSNTVPHAPPATNPHPHTMKLGEFIAYAQVGGRMKVSDWLKKGFSRVHEGTLKELVANKLDPKILKSTMDKITEAETKQIYSSLQKIKLMAPSTKSVLTIGEDALAKSIQRLGEVDFFSVATRKPTICDFKPVSVEIAIARLADKPSGENESSVQVLRFANRVPLQFDKSACAMVKAIESINWRTYGIQQPKNSIPLGPYVIAVSLVSPFIKFKNASKETVDASDELVTELRLALIQAGQRLSRHIKAEHRANVLEEKRQHIEQFAPILVEGLSRITKAKKQSKENAYKGLMKILGRESKEAEKKLQEAMESKRKIAERQKELLGDMAKKKATAKKSSTPEPKVEEKKAKPKPKAGAKKAKPKAKKAAASKAKPKKKATAAKKKAKPKKKTKKK